jgi:2-polyprenyl-6-hydroxyphenyl methylase/3-demethylubiquinone-9 3-methyltransferase
VELTNIPLIIGSILEHSTVEKLLNHSENQSFNVVHSWGVLHHTGSMQKSIQNASSLVKERVFLVISIYNKHWTSPVWLFIKWLYNKLPSVLQKGMVYLFYPVIWLAKYLVTKGKPTQKTRGMDFFYDVVDWVGGYPYEYASKDEIIRLIEPLGFELVRFVPAQVPTGCNEFVFRKNLR